MDITPVSNMNDKEIENKSSVDTTPIIISVGGSLIVPNEIDTLFLKNFKQLIVEHIKLGMRFVIITGGGKICRKYQAAAGEITDISKEDMDWLGIHVTRLNGHLFRTIFHEYAHPKVMTNPFEDIRFNEPILIGAGWRPGGSTDHASVTIAKSFGIKKLINLSNIDYVYTADPRKDPTATPIEEITWPEFRKLIPSEWDPGLSSPFDPIASREAEQLGMEVVVMNGLNLEHLRAYLDNKKFVGTKITPLQ